MRKNVVYHIVIPCFIFKLYTILYDWLMTSFCLQKVMKMYEAGYVYKRKLTPRTFLKLAYLSKHHIVHETLSITFIQLNLNVSDNCSLSKIGYSYISI